MFLFLMFCSAGINDSLPYTDTGQTVLLWSFGLEGTYTEQKEKGLHNYEGKRYYLPTAPENHYQYFNDKMLF
jgi:hypothetical protein